MSDELRQRLARIDPMPPHVPTEPMTSTSSRSMLEEIMSTTIQTRPGSKRNRLVLSAAAVAVAVATIGGALALNQNGEPPLRLALGASDTISSCLPFSVEILADMPLAFEGTAVAVEGEAVTLEVDRWFRGGEAATVVLNAPAGYEALIGGIAFEVGEQYLITATEGTVNYCGYSDVATPELRSAFEQAFGA